MTLEFITIRLLRYESAIATFDAILAGFTVSEQTE